MFIPANRSKNGRAHFVPLSEPARAVISGLIELIDDKAMNICFRHRVNAVIPIKSHALTTPMRRMAAKIEGAALKTWQADPPSPHDLRRTVATRLSQMGTLPETVSAILNHAARRYHRPSL